MGGFLQEFIEKTAVLLHFPFHPPILLSEAGYSSAVNFGTSEARKCFLKGEFFIFIFGLELLGESWEKSIHEIGYSHSRNDLYAHSRNDLYASRKGSEFSALTRKEPE